MSKSSPNSRATRTRKRTPRTARHGNSAAAGNSASQSISAVEIFSMIRRWWWQCGLAGAVLAAAGMSLAWWAFVPTYEASAWLEIKSVPHYIAFRNQDDSRAFAETQLETMRSAIVLSRVASRPEIARCPENSEDAATEVWLKKGLSVQYVGRSELCKVSFQSEHPQTATLVANAVAAEYLALQQDYSSEQTERIIKLLEGQQRERKADVEALRESVRTLVKKTTGHDPVVLGDNQKSIVQRNPFAEAEEHRIAAEVKEALLAAELNALEETIGADRMEIPVGALQEALNSHPDIQRLREHAAMLQHHASEYERLSARGARDPKAVQKAKEAKEIEAALKQRSAELEPLLRKELEASARIAQQEALGGSRLELERARNEHKEWERRAEEQRKELEKHGDDALTLEFLREDLTRSEEVHARIAERIVALKTEKMAPTRVAIRKEAVTPLQPINKSPYRRMAVFGFGAFCVPFGLAFLWERWMRRISDGNRITQESNLPVLGEIASLPSRTTSFEDPSGGLRDRVTFEESIDALRVVLTLSRDCQDIQVLGVTSAVSGEGKTSLASALAISLAHACHEPVLLIDSDMRAPDLQEMFGTPLTPGLAEVLGRECPLSDAIVQNAAENVDLLPAGQLAANPHSLLRNGAMDSLLDEMRRRYRYVVVDTPPVLAASEANVVALACDGVVVCTRCDFSRGRQLRAASERLSTAGARLLGVVMNAVPTRLWAHRYGGYGYGWERYAIQGEIAHKRPASVEATESLRPAPPANGPAE